MSGIKCNACLPPPLYVLPFQTCSMNLELRRRHKDHVAHVINPTSPSYCISSIDLDEPRSLIIVSAWENKSFLVTVRCKKINNTLC